MTRNRITAAKVQTLDAALRDLFRALQGRPTPEIFRLMLDQLQERAAERAAA